MSANSAETLTNVVGYFNANPHPVYFEISEINMKCELAPNAYVRDRAGHLLNDPILEPYVKSKGGLSRATSDQKIPINYAPRYVKSERPVHSVTQATSFVRQPDGTVVPSYARPPATSVPETPMNKVPIIGMTIEKARQLGFIGKPRIIPEDFGVTDTTGAPPSTEQLPNMKYSIESPPRLKTAAPLTPELMEADQRLNPAQIAQRQAIQRSLAHASADQVENFDPSQMPMPAAPVALRASDTPTAMPVATTGVPTALAPQRILPLPTPIRRVATVVQESETAPESGTVGPMGDGMPDPLLDAPPVASSQAEAAGKRFVCAADGKTFRFRSELERYAKRRYPAMLEELMKPYPPEG